MCAPQVTGVGEALVDVALAALADVTSGADAEVAPDAIHALPPVETLGLFGDGVSKRGAVVDVDLTVNTCGGEVRVMI